MIEIGPNVRDVLLAVVALVATFASGWYGHKAHNGARNGQEAPSNEKDHQ